MQKKHQPIIFENIARYTCTFAFFVVPLQREPALGMSAHQRRRVADIIKRRLLALVLVSRNPAKFHIPETRER